MVWFALPQEVEILRNACGEEFKLVTPGIRPIGADFGDQRRVMTPTAAIRAGSRLFSDRASYY